MRLREKFRSKRHPERRPAEHCAAQVDGDRVCGYAAQQRRTAMKILVVDDSKAMRMIVLRALRQSGFGDAETVEAEDGAQGLEKVRAEQPDLVLSDWNMPNLTGIEFLRELRASGNETTFGFVTSESTPAMREQAIAAGAAFLIAKPFTPDAFEEILSGVC
jgi:two-component system chemotaxis response regulator CheY